MKLRKVKLLKTSQLFISRNSSAHFHYQHQIDSLLYPPGTDVDNSANSVPCSTPKLFAVDGSPKKMKSRLEGNKAQGIAEVHTSQTVNIVCMKWGDLYGPEYVNRLFGMVHRHLKRKFRFYCITDDPANIRKEVIIRQLPEIPLPKNAEGPWRKLFMFKKDLFDITGKTMFLDLDVVIVGELDRFFSYSSKFAVRHEFDRRKENDSFGNTSMYVFEAGSYPYIYYDYVDNKEEIYAQYYSAEQEYVTRTLHSRGELEFLPNNWVVSFKEHCLPPWPRRLWETPQFPEKASIIAFHGRPLPEDAIQGKWPLDGKPFWKSVYKHTKPCPWLEEHWRS